MPSLTKKSHRRNVSRWKIRIRIKRIWIPASRNVITYTPFLLVDGLLFMEAEAALKRIAIRLTTNWKQTYLQTYRYINSWVSITLVCAIHRCIQGFWFLLHKIRIQEPQWEDEASLNHFLLNKSQETNLIEKFILFTPRRKREKNGDQKALF